MDLALWLCLIPLVWAAIAHFVLPKTVSWREGALQGGIGVFLVLVIYMSMFWSNTTDVELLNGQVTSKQQTRVSCSHSYSCNCRESCSGSGSNRSCSTTCDTCYEHPYDWDWDVLTTVGTITIDRIDRRGSYEPPRWTAVQIGEPAAREHRYTNYIKAAPHSLFNMKLAEQDAKKHAALIPVYPRVYDYYRVDHVIDINTGVKNRQQWDAEIDASLRSLGGLKQANIIVVFVRGVGREYKTVLERAWVGGKKNDVVIIVGTEGTAIKWVEAFTFGKTSGNAMLAVRLRDELQAFGTTTEPAAAVAIITRLITTNFKRKPMAEYKYLASEAGPSATQLGWLVGILTILLTISTVLLHKYDLFGEGRQMWSRFSNTRFSRYKR